MGGIREAEEMSKIYLLEPGFVEPSVIYEVQLKEVARLEKATVDEVCNKLDSLGAKRIIIDEGYPNIFERIRIHFFAKQVVRRPLKEKKNVK